MPCRGVHFALSDDDRANLLGAVGDDDALLYVIQEEIEEQWDRDWLCETDKAWDAIHRCLTDGTLADDDATPLHWCVLNGTQLYGGDDYIVSLVEPNRVPAVAGAVAKIDRDALRSRYDSIDPSDYGMPLSDEDFQYTWENFNDLRALFQKAAASGRAVVFTVDQ